MAAWISLPHVPITMHNGRDCLRYWGKSIRQRHDLQNLQKYADFNASTSKGNGFLGNSNQELTKLHNYHA